MTVPNAIGECDEYQGAMVAYETMAGFSQVGEIFLAPLPLSCRSRWDWG